MRFLLNIIVTLVSIQTYAQLVPDYPVTEIEPSKLIVNYSLQYQPDSLPPHFTRQEDQVLFIGENVSLFLSYNSWVFEKEMRKQTNTQEVQEYLFTKPAMPHNLIRIYKHIPDGKLTFCDWVTPNNLKYEEKLDLFNWQLTGDTANIKAYKAQKATCDFEGRSWIAWFTAEIPYSDGPYKFNGLPGLILNMYDTRNYYVYELISIEKPSEEIMIEYLNKEFVETTKHEYFKALDDFNANLVTWARDNGASGEAQKNAARISIERNNPIELIRK